MKKLLLTFMIILMFLFSGCLVSYKTITFDSDGGTPVESIKVKTGELALEPEAPTKENSEFLGWYLDEELFDFDNTKIEENITLVAKWNSLTTAITHTVTFYDKEDNVLKTEIVEEGGSATAPTPPTITGYLFKEWDVDFTNVKSDLTVKPVYEIDNTKYTVTFYDKENNVLKIERVEEGGSATAPTPPTITGYLFKEWDVDFTNVKADLSVKPVYEIDKTKYKITYVLNGGSWTYANKTQYVEAFLKDFYNFVQPSETLNTFLHGESAKSGFKGTWTNYVGGCFEGDNYLLVDNNIDANDDDYFFNSKTYKTKWYALSSWVKNEICKSNNRFGGTNYTYGVKDFYRYIINDAEGYENVYGTNFTKYPEVSYEVISEYQYQDTDITLTKPLSDKFEGWYLNSDFSGDKVTTIKAHSVGDLILYAKWDETVTYEIVYNTQIADLKYNSVTVKKGDVINLPTASYSGYTFLGWYYNDTKVESPFTFNYNESIVLLAKWDEAFKLVDLKYDGSAVKYRNSSVTVTIPNKYVQPERQLRAVWVTSHANNFTPSPNKATMQANLLEVLELMEQYNMNCIIFHIRTLNNAFYKTKLAPIASNYGTYESFGQWDYLEWFIGECHKRGIEFHAWLNPYRIYSHGLPLDETTPEDVAMEYVNYPDNPASNPDNILITYYQGKSHGAILDPAKEEVQNYIVNVCKEVMQNYDVDAIHFDDYFYAQMSSGITVLTEPDQAEYEAYIDKNGGYSKTSASDKKEWRRNNVTNMIRKLHSAIVSFNAEYNKNVQLGISPTGIYKNGNGSVNSGSNTSGQQHYESYLFCDSKLWIQQELIDYIMPQSYWAFTHSVAGYADVMDWWNDVVNGTSVDLYSGIGLYMAEPNTNYSWGRQEYEIANQVLYTTKLNNCKGVSIYSFSSLKMYSNDSTSVPYQGLQRLKEYWSIKVKTPNQK